MNSASRMERDQLGLENAFIAPRTQTELEIVELFEEVFNTSGIGIDDDFFDLGGDSLQAEELSIGLEKLHGCDFQVSTIGDFASPRMIARLLEGSTSVETIEAKSIIFLVHGRGGYTLPPRAFVDVFKDRYEVKRFELPALRKPEREISSVPELARHYLDIVDQEQPRGDINLASFCIGGLIAIEMTRQASERGRSVRSLAMFDPNIRKNTERAMAGSATRRFISTNPIAHRLRFVRYWFQYIKQKHSGRVRYPHLRASPRVKLQAAYDSYFPSVPQTQNRPLVIRTNRALRVSLDKLLHNRIEHRIDANHRNSIFTHSTVIAKLMRDYFDNPDG